ncbi:MAG: helix-turn-helix domain-containing protein [Clostridiales bacterium]|nr:helix-turn-helix domain-containing protein [Clostridiales bacterium]
MTLANRLRDLRLNARKTMQELSEGLEVSVNTIYRWEHNVSVPRKVNLAAIAGFYGVELDWLLSGRKGINSMAEDSQLYKNDLELENPLEEQLLAMYRMFSENSKHKILGYVERMCLENIDNGYSEHV